MPNLTSLPSYRVGVSAEGVLQGVELDSLCDAGWNTNDNSAGLVATWISNVYQWVQAILLALLRFLMCGRCVCSHSQRL